MRRGGRRSRADGQVEIPVDSFGDIAFLLIIFFILVTALHKTLGMISDLPSGERSQAKVEKTPSVSLHDGKISYNDKDTTLANLKGSLATLSLSDKKGEEKVILLEAAGKVPYQQYYEVMTAISKAGGIVAIVRESDGKESK